jgi:non-heme chloroperoxidase
MTPVGISIVAVLVAATPFLQPSTGWRDPSPHTVRLVAVEQNVQLEVLDWGGTGRPVVLLAGGGNTAHVFDEFAPRLAANHHVYGITRRGFGASGFSATAAAVDRLRDDVLAVIDSLKLERPVLAGHSVAGAEMSAVAASQPDRIAGLVYIDAGYPYAYASSDGPTMAEFQIGGPQAPRATAADLASFSALQSWDALTYGFQMPEAEFRQMWEADAADKPRRPREFPGAQLFGALLDTPKPFTRIAVPSLAIFASPHLREPWIARSGPPAVQDAARTYYAAIDASTERQAAAFAAGVATARVIRLRGAHYIFLSNERETLREIRTFVAGLK